MVEEEVVHWRSSPPSAITITISSLLVLPIHLAKSARSVTECSQSSVVRIALGTL